jgi:hypothetical protein
MISNERRFQFLLEQFKLHSQRLHDFHSERYKITTWSILAIFGYFGWILTNPHRWDIFSRFVLVLPVILVAFGFVYVIGLHLIIDRHGHFLDHLEREMFSGEHSGEFLTEWQKFKNEGHEGKPLRATLYFLWARLLVGTLVASVWLK